MSFISAFDVMGPNMIGPSSSHTAGAARISYLAQKMIEGPLKRADFILYGSFSIINQERDMQGLANKGIAPEL